MINKALNFILAVFFLCTHVCYGRNYYVDFHGGCDSNNGKRPSEAWKTLEKINSTFLEPGDKVYFSRSAVWTGQLEIRNSGTWSRPIVISSYGKGKTRPTIAGNGEKDYALLIENASYVKIRGLEITNWGKDPSPGRRGILLRARDCGDVRHVHISDMSIHDVNGSLKKSKGGGSGIMVSCSGESVPSRFIDLKIEGCHIYNCMRNGINFNGNSSRRQWNPSLRVVIRGNLLENIPGDGIVPIGCDGALIEKNVLRDAPDIMDKNEAAAGIWPWSSDNTVIRYNEVSGQKAKWDGQGFDADYNCLNTVFRYNYSHDNYGGFFLVCNDGKSLGKSWNIGTENVLIEKNVSINDGIRPYETRSGWLSPTFHISGPVNRIVIRDNLVIMPSKKADDAFVTFNDWGDSWPKDVRICSNNIILSDTLKVNIGGMTEDSISDNHVRTCISDQEMDSAAKESTLLKKILNRVKHTKSIR